MKKVDISELSKDTTVLPSAQVQGRYFYTADGLPIKIRESAQLPDYDLTFHGDQVVIENGGVTTINGQSFSLFKVHLVQLDAPYERYERQLVLSEAQIKQATDDPVTYGSTLFGIIGGRP